MCGIAGFINIPNSKIVAQEANAIQQHRGPDDQSIWAHNNVTFAHQRLSIIDLDSRSNQPMVKHNLAIIFNGEIYNYLDLKKKILAQSPEILFNTQSDTEVLLELYRQKKEKCLDDLRGMFAFAIYEIDTGKLFLARDHFGIKPLFYTYIGNGFAFSSELKTLTKLPGFDKTINKQALLGAINYLWIPGNDSIFNNCFKIPAAHYVILDTVSETPKITCKQYWEPGNSILYKDEPEAIHKLTECIENAVKIHMVADVPVSSFLSGGLDSSLISVIASQSTTNLSTYTIGITEADKKVEKMPDDEKYANLLAEQFHFNHHTIKIKADIINDLPKIVYMLDEPIGDPAAINTYLICKTARENGVKVLLSGMGADEIFFGYRRQKATLLSFWFQKLPKLIQNSLGKISAVLPVKMAGKGIKFTRWAKRFLSFAALPAEEAYMRSYSYYSKEELQQLFRDNITIEYQKLRDSHASVFNRYYTDNPVNQMCYTDLHLFMQGLNLTYTDRASMAASVEVRVPFIDKEVVTMAMQIDGSLKYKQKQSKYILKKIAEKFLPERIIYRPKASFGAPIRSWISNDLKKMVDDLLSEENVTKRGLFNYSYIKKLVNDDRNGLEDNAYRIYQLLTIELWSRCYLDN
ncbi:MAG: asparagine synthase (glutamine-hydrolyzing) [Sphingobacteriales bacterium]